MTQFVGAYRVDPLSGVRTRRIVALVFDLILVSMLVFVIWFALVILTLGLALILLPPLYPFVAFFYNGLTVSGRKMGTPGMRLMGLEMRMHVKPRRPRSLHQRRRACDLFLHKLVLSAGVSRLAVRRREALRA